MPAAAQHFRCCDAGQTRSAQGIDDRRCESTHPLSFGSMCTRDLAQGFDCCEQITAAMHNGRAGLRGHGSWSAQRACRTRTDKLRGRMFLRSSARSAHRNDFSEVRPAQTVLVMLLVGVALALCALPFVTLPGPRALGWLAAGTALRVTYITMPRNERSRCRATRCSARDVVAMGHDHHRARHGRYEPRLSVRGHSHRLTVDDDDGSAWLSDGAAQDEALAPAGR